MQSVARCWLGSAANVTKLAVSSYVSSAAGSRLRSLLGRASWEFYYRTLPSSPILDQGDGAPRRRARRTRAGRADQGADPTLARRARLRLG